MDDLDPAIVSALSEALVPTWPVVPPIRLTRLTGGINSLVFRVEAAIGPACILRVLRSHRDLDRVRHEVAVLRALQRAALPFAVPSPLPARSGECAHVVESDMPLLEGALAMLYREIAGTHPDPADEGQTEASGAALGLLDAALAGLDRVALPGHGGLPGRDLRRHISSPEEVEAVLSQLPVSAQERASLTAQFRAAEAGLASLYSDGGSRLPWQLINGDVDSSNILMDGGRVSGMLDFEFVKYDQRIHDLSNALFSWNPDLLDTDAGWRLMDALGRGYTSHLPLLPEEVRALPILFRARAAGGLGRDLAWYREGRRSEQRLLERVEYTFMRERWLRQNESRLLAMAEGWTLTR